jgi:hypothetical protein
MEPMPRRWLCFLAAAAALAVVTGCTTKKLETTGTTTTTGGSNTTTTERSSGTTRSPGTTGSNGTGSTTTTAEPIAVEWERNAAEYRGQNGRQLTIGCSSEGTVYTVWGTGTYTDDSSICTAAVHAGLITLASGGTVVIEIAPGQAEYTGSEANGIESLPYGPWDGSYTFVG